MMQSKPVRSPSGLLASRRFRRRLLVVIWLVSYLTAAAGFILPARPSTPWLFSLVWVAAAVELIAFVLLGISTNFYRWWDGLDERERTVMARAHFLTYQRVMFPAVFFPFYAYFLTAEKHGLWIPRSGMEFALVLLWLFNLNFFAPLGIIGWTEPDPPTD